MNKFFKSTAATLAAFFAPALGMKAIFLFWGVQDANTSLMALISLMVGSMAALVTLAIVIYE